MNNIKKVSLVIFLLLPTISYSQTVYVSAICAEECNKCAKTDPPMKVTYKADKRTNKVFRTIDDKNPQVMTDCTVMDEGNWVCQGHPSYSDYSKQYALNGVAFWNTSEPDPVLDKKLNAKFSCRYEKSIFGTYKVIDQIKKY
jgi:hypothetical protein